MKNNNDLSVQIRCDDRTELLTFHRFELSDNDCFFEINIEDAYCNGDYMGIKGRFKRAWKAFWAKPISYTGICVTDRGRLIKFLEECMEAAKEEVSIVKTNTEEQAPQ